ncbi:hypothetical protein Scep_005050 [Stephania cephalantha]|uniref:DUF547 domain-containing protein n=1 Tax=Stephania cephalantha TaxID=152367 RepID=A0AAP0KTS9_9MAGN
MASSIREKPEFFPSPRGTSKETGVQQRKEELEKEVSMLHKMLDQEEKVHEILEQMLHRNVSSSVHIPSFLPPKMKELIAELVVVEDEIVHLEDEIRRLKSSLSQEQDMSKDSMSKKCRDEIVRDSNFEFIVPSNLTPMSKGLHERITFDIKALYFISKAIKGDYTQNGFNSIEKKENSKRTSTYKKKYSSPDVQEKELKKSGMAKPEPPQLLPRNSANKPNIPEPENFAVESSPSSESNSKAQPNKLSESIMKCLIFIFLRLLRASRVLEIEKSVNISRSTQLSSGSRSFRVENGVNSNSGVQLQGELRQQDPYGIFDIEDSIARDIGPYKNLVKFASNSLDPKCISTSNSIPLLQKLRGLLEDLQKVDLKFLTHQQKLAFWINIYNACVMHGFIQYGVPSSPEKLLALMNKATLNVGGNKINALAIEHFILRAPSASSKLKNIHWKGADSEKEFIIRNIYGLESLEPNVTFALCCGTRSSPAVRIYNANNVTSELEKAKLEYLQASVVVRSTKKLMFPELLLQNTLDFASDSESLVEWVCQQLPTHWSLRKAMVDCFKGHNSGTAKMAIEKMPYDFDFQYLLPI